MKKNKMLLLKRIFLAGWHPYFWIFAVGFMLYGRTIFFDYTYLDDNALILNDYQFISDFSNIFKAFLRDAFGTAGGGSDAFYRPLQTVMFMIGAHISGTKLYAYHAINILVHLASAMLLFTFLQKLDYRKSLSFVLSLLFVVHPVLTLAVAYVPGLNDPLLTLFSLAAFITLIDLSDLSKGGINDVESLPPKYLAKYFYHLVFFVLALLSKESAVLIVPLALIYLLMIKKERLFSFNQQVLIVGYFVSGLIWFLVRRIALSGQPYQLEIMESIRSLWANLPVLIQNIGKLILPFNLSSLSTARDTTLVYGIVATIILLVLIFFSRNKRSLYIVFGLIWYLSFLLPTLIFHNPGLDYGYDYQLEHRMHLAMIGLLIVIAEIDWLKSVNFGKASSAILVEILIVLFATLTIFHSEHFKNRISFWQNAVKNAPHSPLAQRNLGAMYYLDGRLDEAEPLFKRALELNSNEQMAHGNLGLIYADRGDDARAEEEYKKELEINPNYDHGHFNLALLYYKQGKIDEAEKLWLKTIQINPDYLGAYNNLILSFYNQQKFSEAKNLLITAQSRGLQIAPQLINALNASSGLKLK